MGAASRSRDAPTTPRSIPPVTLARLRADASRRVLAGVLALPLGTAVAWLAVWSATTTAPGVRVWLGAVASLAQAGVVWPRLLRMWRLSRTRRRERTSRRDAVVVRIAVLASGPLSAVPATLAVWSSESGDGPPERVDAADLSTRPLVDGGRMWATVVGGPHRLATYRLDDGTPVVGAGRTNVLQRWVVRGRIRDTRRRRARLDRRLDAPYPRPALAGELRSELRAVAVTMGAVVVVLAATGWLVSVLAIVASR